MRVLLKPMMPHLKWPLRVGVFLAHLMHHTAAFFAWIWMLVQVIGTTAQAGLHVTKIWEAQVLSEIWRDGIGYFSLAGGSDWKRLFAIALIPAALVAFRNAIVAYESLHAWVHEHRHKH